MNVTLLSRWHWMVIGLLAGALYGGARESAANFYDELSSYGPRRIGQREFEAAVASKFHGKARFSDLAIRPYRLAPGGGPTVTVHVVSGLYWDGKTQTENGRVAAHWAPAYFVASAPYFPIKPARPTTSPATSAAVAPPAAQFDDVMAYLRSSPGGERVAFEYATWWWATRPQVVWTAAGLLVIGGVWPTVVNLLAFGTLLRPAEAKGLSLWRAKSPVPRANPATAELDPSALEAFERGLADESAGTPPESPAAPAAPAIRALRGAEPETAAAVAADPHTKDFGQDKEDFYPTELRAKHDT